MITIIIILCVSIVLLAYFIIKYKKELKRVSEVTDKQNEVIDRYMKENYVKRGYVNKKQPL